MFKRRIMIALSSTVIFSIILAFIMYTPISDRQSNTWYDPLSAPLPFLLLITGAAYVLGGVPVSTLIDKYVEKAIIKLPFYILAGFIVGCITIMITFGTISLEILSFGIYGATGSLIFFILMSLNKAFEKTPSRNGSMS